MKICQIDFQSMEGIGRLKNINPALETQTINTIFISCNILPDIPIGVHPVYSSVDLFGRSAKALEYRQYSRWEDYVDGFFPDIGSAREFIKSNLPILHTN